MKYKSLIYLLFTLSGFVGLIYESIWSKYLKLLLGHASYGQILTLIIYMGGLGLGAYLFGRITHRLNNPLRTYAVLEVCIGLGGLCYHSLYTWSTQHYFDWVSTQSALSGIVLTLIKLSLALILTAPWAILLGGTFPCLAVGLMRLLQDSGKSALPWLYFTNSLGGALGILCTSYIFISAYGTPGTLLLAGSLNLAIGVIFLGLARWSENTQALHSHTQPVQAEEQEQPNSAPTLTRPVGILILTATMTGFSSFLYEIGWIRLLSLLLGASTHSFDVMISAFILGLAFGGLFARGILKRVPQIWLALACIQICMGLFAALSLLGYDSLFRLVNKSGEVFQQTEAAYYVFAYFKYIVSLLLMFPASFCAGMTLPLITYLMLQENAQHEKWVGYVYAWNTVGAIAGAALGGLYILPLLQLEGLILLGAFIDLVIAWLILSHCSSSRPVKAALVFCSLILILPFWGLKLDIYQLTSGVFRNTYTDQQLQQRRERVSLKVQHGRTATIAFADDGKNPFISTNGKVDASVYTGPPEEIAKREGSLDDYTQASLAFLALNYIQRPYEAAVIGLGSGMTAHFLLGDPLLKNLDLIEIEPAMYDMAQLFRPRNERVYSSPKIQLHLEDAKSFFYEQNKRYDLIVSEPSNPWVSGVSSLFTQEFYRDIHQFLNPQGVLVQWIHTYEFSDELLFSVFKAMSQEFQQIQIHAIPKRDQNGQAILDATDLIILASNQPLQRGPAERIEKIPGLAQDLAPFLSKPSDYTRLSYMLSSQSLQPLLKNYPANSDFYPVVDNGAELAFYTKQSAAFLGQFLPSSPLLYPALFEERYMEYKAQVLEQDPQLRSQVLQMRSLLNASPHDHNPELDRAFFKTFLRVHPFIDWEKSQLAQGYQKHMAKRPAQDLARQKFELLRSFKVDGFAARQAQLNQFLKQVSPPDLDMEFVRYLIHHSLKYRWRDSTRQLMKNFILPNPHFNAVEKQFLIQSSRHFFKDSE